MSESARRPYLRPVSKTAWWLKRPLYQRYMIREASCLFIGLYALLLIYGIKQITEGPEAYGEFLSLLGNPLMIGFQLVALLLALYHSMTWFNLMPQTTPILIGETFLPAWVMIVGQYSAWIIVSLLVLFLARVF